MNRLNKSLCYLCGAMDRVEDGGIGWREYISTKLRDMSIGVLNPCDKPTHYAKIREKSTPKRPKINQSLSNGDPNS